MKHVTDFSAGLGLLVLCAIGAYGTLTSSAPPDGEVVGPLMLPWLAIGGCAICALVLLYQSLCTTYQALPWGNTRAITKTLLFFIFFCVYLAAMIFFGDWIQESDEPVMPYGGGFVISTMAFLCASMCLLGRRKWLEIGTISVVMTGGLLFTFGYCFNIMLP